MWFHRLKMMLHSTISEALKIDIVYLQFKDTCNGKLGCTYCKSFFVCLQNHATRCPNKVLSKTLSVREVLGRQLSLKIAYATFSQFKF